MQDGLEIYLSSWKDRGKTDVLTVRFRKLTTFNAIINTKALETKNMIWYFLILQNVCSTGFLDIR